MYDLNTLIDRAWAIAYVSFIHPSTTTYPFRMSDVSDEDSDDDFYEEVELGDMDYEEETMSYYYPCPCGDRFVIAREDLEEGEDIAYCPSCSLRIRVVVDEDDVEDGDADIDTTTA